MAASLIISETVIQDCIVRAVRNVSHTMMRSEAVLLGRIAESTPAGTYEMIGSVGFAGEINGLVYLCLSAEFARHATGLILGMTPGEVAENGPEVVKDAIGEITNMTAGVFKNQLCDMGFQCKLTLPTIILGQNLSVAATKQSSRHTFSLSCSGHTLIADIQLKTE